LFNVVVVAAVVVVSVIIIVDFPQSVVIAGKYRGYMDCALYILCSYGVKRPHIVLRYKPNFMFKG